MHMIRWARILIKQRQQLSADENLVWDCLKASMYQKSGGQYTQVDFFSWKKHISLPPRNKFTFHEALLSRCSPFIVSLFSVTIYTLSSRSSFSYIDFAIWNFKPLLKKNSAFSGGLLYFFKQHTYHNNNILFPTEPWCVAKRLSLSAENCGFRDSYISTSAKR